MKRLNQIGLWFISALFLTSGVSHFLLTRFFVAIMPPYMPLPSAAVYVSGAFEIIGAIGLLITAYRYAAGSGLFVLTILVTPANIHMALNPELFPAFSESLLYWRLVAQVGLLALDLHRSNPTAATHGSAGRARNECSITNDDT